MLQHPIKTMLNQSQIETPFSLASPGCPADNHARRLAQFLYETLALMPKKRRNMKNSKTNEQKSPSKKKLKILTILWLFSTITFLLLMTDFLKESPFKSSHIGFYMILFVSTLGIIKIYSDYRKAKPIN